MSDATAFEAALRDHPDDLAGWCAYADYLVERGDPRGEFMQVQIALEDESRPKEERDALKKREKALRKAHEREWLGELAPFVYEPGALHEPDLEPQFTRGWPTGLTCLMLSVNEVHALGRAPEAKMLDRLLIDRAADEDAVEEPAAGAASGYAPGPDVPEANDSSEAPALYAPRHVPHLGAVRVFRYGDGPTGIGNDGQDHGPCWANGSAAHEVVAHMPRLEELYLYAYDVNLSELFALPLSRLRVLRVDDLDSYPLEVLASNRSLGNLTHICCHPHAQRPDDPHAYIRLGQLRAICHSPHLKSLTHLQLRLTDFGDAGAESVVASGVLKRLKVLDLSYGCITDDGARALAACPDLRRLDLLDLTMNALTDVGIAALAATGVTVLTDLQHGEHPDRIEENGWLEYLSHGDME